MKKIALFIALFVVPDLRAGEEPIAVPYRRTDTQHILIRAKINGKGPFNFIIDTGAPAMFVADEVGKKLGLDTDKGWATLDRLDIEGGVRLDKVKVRVETPFQLEGMNGMNLAGARLHGIIGYMVLARFRMDIDLTKDKMLWTPLGFDPPPPKGIAGKGGQGGLEIIGTVLKFVGVLAGRKAPTIETRGFLGLEFEEKQAVVRAVLARSPAAEAGIQVGDRIAAVNGKTAGNLGSLGRLLAQVAPGQNLRLTIRRNGDEKVVELKAGDGL